MTYGTIYGVGAGPGGLEAALTAARRGHTVTVFEQSESCGGQFLYASSVPHRQRLRQVVLGDELRAVEVHRQQHAVGGEQVHRGGEADRRVRHFDAGKVARVESVQHISGEPHALSPPMPVPSGSPPWIMKPSITR